MLVTNELRLNHVNVHKLNPLPKGRGKIQDSGGTLAYQVTKFLKGRVEIFINNSRREVVFSAENTKFDIMN